MPIGRYSAEDHNLLQAEGQTAPHRSRYGQALARTRTAQRPIMLSDPRMFSGFFGVFVGRGTRFIYLPGPSKSHTGATSLEEQPQINRGIAAQRLKRTARQR